MKKFIVDRKTWLRGEGGSRSSLLRANDNKMCCLGFLSCELGLQKSEIREVPHPANLSLIRSVRNKFEGLLNEESRLTNVCEEIMRYNDSKNITDAERENSLTKEFKSINWEVEFIN